MIALLIGYEAVERLLNPVAISFNEAIPIAVLGLAVNVASAWLLSGRHHHGHDHGHGVMPTATTTIMMRHRAGSRSTPAHWRSRSSNTTSRRVSASGAQAAHCRMPDSKIADKVRQTTECEGDHVTDLHLLAARARTSRRHRFGRDHGDAWRGALPPEARQIRRPVPCHGRSSTGLSGRRLK
jgi:hypothetical protein